MLLKHYHLKKLISLQLVSILLVLVNTHSAYAQPVDEDMEVLYWEVGLGYGTHTQFKVAANKPIATDKLVSLAFNAYVKNYDDVPGDFTTGFTFLGDGIPNQYMLMMSALFGKVLPQSRNMNVCLKGGLSCGVVQYPVFFKADRQGGMLGFGPKYYVDYDNKFVAGLIVNPVAEFLISDQFGIGMGLNGNLNTYSPSLCFELNVLVGRLRAASK
jgi:hypothetical protein